MHPMIQYSNSNENYQRVKQTSEDVLTSFCTGPFSHSEHEGFVYYDVFPSFGLLWYELVSGLMVLNYCCLLMTNNKQFTFSTTPQ
jgi:hypothetical protein